MAEDNLLDNMSGSTVSIGILAGLWYLSDNKPSWTGFRDPVKLLAMAFGGASANGVGQIVTNAIGNPMGVGDDLVQALTSLGMAKYGGRYNKRLGQIGKGMILGTAFDAFNELGLNVGNIVEGGDFL